MKIGQVMVNYVIMPQYIISQIMGISLDFLVKNQEKNVKNKYLRTHFCYKVHFSVITILIISKLEIKLEILIIYGSKIA